MKNYPTARPKNFFFFFLEHNAETQHDTHKMEKQHKRQASQLWLFDDTCICFALSEQIFSLCIENKKARYFVSQVLRAQKGELVLLRLL